MNRNNLKYIRILELLSIVSEEWGEAIKATNNHIWKGEDIISAIRKLTAINSPLLELKMLLETINKNNETNKK